MNDFSGNRNFFAEEWHWLAAGAGIAAFAAMLALTIVAFGVNPDDAADRAVREIGGRKADGTGVEPVDLAAFAAAKKAVSAPFLVSEPVDTQGGYLASARRVFCESGEAFPVKKACALPIPYGSKVCPFCSIRQPDDVKVVLDGDGDGLPDEWEKKYGLDPKNVADAAADKDGDGFTNMEEFLAGTDPTDPSSHVDYLKFLKIVPPLKHTLLPIVFTGVAKTPAGMKFFFRDPKKRGAYGQRGVTYAVMANEPIGDTGFAAKEYVEKIVKEKIRGSNQFRPKDISYAVVERISDRKPITLRVGDRRFASVDMKVTLSFSLDGGKEFTVAPGEEVTLYRDKYTVKEIVRDGRTARVTLVLPDGIAERTLETLEQ